MRVKIASLALTLFVFSTFASDADKDVDYYNQVVSAFNVNKKLVESCLRSETDKAMQGKESASDISTYVIERCKDFISLLDRSVYEKAVIESHFQTKIPVNSLITSYPYSDYLSSGKSIVGDLKSRIISDVIELRSRNN